MFSQFDNAEVGDYFLRLNAQLKKMPAEDRREMHLELRQHIDALAAAHEELGASPDEALRAALDQLGEPKGIGRRLFQEWRKTAFPGEREVLPATLTVLFIHFLGIYAILVGMGSTLTLPPWVTFGTMVTAAPIAAGVTAGSLFRQGGLKGVIIGHTFVPVLMIAPMMVGYRFTNAVQLLIDTQIFLVASGLWMAVGCGAAFLTGLVRRRNLPLMHWPRLKLGPMP